MKGELVTSTTPDLVRLHGFFSEAAESTRHAWCDAALVLHGLGGNFYSSRLNLRLAQELQQLGMATVLGNTRGHDSVSMSTVSGRAQTIGSANEIVDDCRNDIAGWVDWLVKQGYQRVLLVGHSLGAIKSLYAQAHQPHTHVQGIVGLSATRLSHQPFLESERKEDFLKWFERATQLVSDGQSQTLLQVDFPFPTTLSAQTYVDKYGPDDRYDWTRTVGRISVPVLLMFGENELRDNAAFQGLFDEVQPLLEPYRNYELHVVPSADHFYSGVHHRAAEVMQHWLDQRTA